MLLLKLLESKPVRPTLFTTIPFLTTAPPPALRLTERSVREPGDALDHAGDGLHVGAVASFHYKVFDDMAEWLGHDDMVTLAINEAAPAACTTASTTTPASRCAQGSARRSAARSTHAPRSWSAAVGRCLRPLQMSMTLFVTHS